MPPWKFPPPPSSEEYQAQLRDLQSEAADLIKNQHVVSQVLLRRFSGQDRNGGPELIPFDLQFKRQMKKRGTAACGKVKNLVAYASRSVEQIWKNVEDALGDAVDKIERGRTDLSTARIIKDAIALHLTRSMRYMKINNNSAVEAARFVRNKLLTERNEQLRIEFVRRHGFEATDPRQLISLTDELLIAWEDRIQDGSLARASIENMFNRTRKAVNEQSLRIWRTPTGTELLISDSPAFTFQYSSDRSNMRLNVAIGDAHGIVLPLGRTTLACIGGKKKRGTLNKEQVDLFNRAQAMSADRYIYYHPNSKLEQFVASIPRA